MDPHILQALQALAQGVNNARDLILKYLLHMSLGRVRVLPKQQGIYFQEVPHNFQVYVAKMCIRELDTTYRDDGIMEVPEVHSFLQTSDNLFLQMGLEGGGSL